jgi:hypothetical protein
MNLVLNNPYRILGLLVGASAKEQDRRIRRLKQFIDADQTPDEEYSLPNIGKLKKKIDDISEAESKLNLDSDKIAAALFWFYIGNHITDEPALDLLKSGDIDGVISIWSKLIASGEVTSKNASAYSNFSTLYLSGILEGTNSNRTLYENGVFLKLKFLESDFAQNLKSSATDDNFQITKKNLQFLFLNQLQSEIEQSKKISNSEFLQIISKNDFSAKDEFILNFSQKPIQFIESEIEKSKNQRTGNKNNANKIGDQLYKNTVEPLKELESLIGQENLKFISVSDKLAIELLECSIAYYNYHIDQEFEVDDFVTSAIKLAEHAKNIAKGSICRDRISENLSTIEAMKERELNQIIEFIQMVKNLYEENERTINAEVDKLKNSYDVRFGNTTINYHQVKENIKNSVNWTKINERITELLTKKSLMKIKHSDDKKRKDEFVKLANWLESKSQRSSVISKIITDYGKIPPKLPLTIVSSEITNTDKQPLYTKCVRYIGLNLSVKPLSFNNFTLDVKYISPTGTLKRNVEKSPLGYTQSIVTQLRPGASSLSISGWGNGTSCIYEVGTHRIEIYFEGFLIHSKTFEVTLSPLDKLQSELKIAESKLKEIQNIEWYSSEISYAKKEMIKVKEWHFLRSQSERDRQIREQQMRINNLVSKAENEKKSKLQLQNKIISELKEKIKTTYY